MEENKKEMSNKEFAIGCVGLIAVLALVLFLFMGCMAKMTEDSQPSKEEKEIEETNKRLEEKAKKTEKENTNKSEEVKKISEADIEDFKDTVQRRLEQNGLDNYVTKVDTPNDDTISYYVSNDVKQLTKKEKENLSTNIGKELQGAALATYLGGDKNDVPFIDGFYENKEPFSRTSGLDINKFSIIN
ncbi:hypothetical protein [Mammaliicoccus sciuri]|uniref:hypothetical protein n=1 Tax=Mammaliicoccus sciuri TaxID=1296 RepID=UPI000D1F8B4B|nr:hypothetical protein [Mammaliicoccus sciuri]PTJ53901.1 hypothetical protein BU012_02280 [Mammaliicoccus sciuri]